VFDENLIFDQKNSVIDKKFGFDEKIRFLIQILVLHNLDFFFLQKFPFFTEISFFGEKFGFVQNRVSWVTPKMSQLFDIAYYTKIERSHSLEKIG